VFNLQGSEIVVILLLALVILGPEKLPDAIRRFTQTYGELKKMGSGFQSELKNALDEPMREMRETADLVREAADPRKMTGERPSTKPAESPPADTPVAAAAEPSAPPPADDEVLGEMWEDDALYPGSSTVGTPPSRPGDATASEPDPDPDTTDEDAQ